MRRVSGLAGLAICLCLSPAPIQASVVVSTTLGLTQLQIIVTGPGSLQILSPFTAGAFAQAQDSLGGFAQQFNTIDDGAASAAAVTALANATGSASIPAATVGAFSGVNIGAAASASSTGQGALGPAFGLGQGLFEITSPANTSVTVTFDATLHVNQFLQTDANGVTASSEATFLLLLPDLPNQPLLFFDNPLTIGPSAVGSFSGNPSLTGSVTLQTNTQYTLIAEADSESSGLNTVPEPSTRSLLGPALAVLLAYGCRRVAGQPREIA